MTAKEIIHHLIRLEPTPRQPVALLSAGAWTLNQSGLTLESALAAGVAAMVAAAHAHPSAISFQPDQT